MQDMAAEFGDRVRFVKLNVDDNPWTASRYSVLSIPTVILFEGGEVKETVVGARPRSTSSGLGSLASGASVAARASRFPG